MAEIKQILELLATLGFSPLNIILIAIIYVLGAQLGAFPKFWNVSDENKSATLADLHREVTILKGYFNHETTERLRKIHAATKETKEGVEQIKRKHDEYDKFGIRVREGVK